MRAMATVLASLLTSCASLRSDVFENIHEGDSAEHVLDVLGEPAQSGPSPLKDGATNWNYVRRGDQCDITLQEDVVRMISCETREDYVNPIAAVLGSAGSGLKNASANRVNCTTTGDSGIYTSTCR